MGLLNSDSDDESRPGTFEPVCTDGNRVLGYYNDPDTDHIQLVWVNSQAFDKIDAEDIDRIVR